MNRPAQATDRPAADRPWVGPALILVLLTLATLVVVPSLVQRRVDALRTEIEASEPARTLVARLRYNLVREMAALSELLLTGDQNQAASYAEAAAAESAIYDELLPLAGRLGPQVVEHYVEARTLAAQWHARADEDEIMRLRMEGTSPAEIPRERPLFEAALRATATLDSVIVDVTARSRAQIVATEQRGLQFTVLLGVLALIAAMAAAALYVRLRSFAAESERRRLIAEDALSDSARANAARTRVLRGVTHDVKNPLGAALGYAELLAMEIKGPLLPEQAPLVAGVQRSVESALAIITDLLDVARADSGGITIHVVPTDLADVLRTAVEDHRPAAEAAGHTLHLEPPREPMPTHTDPARVRQVLDNLLSNATKYTPAPGVITVHADIDNSGVNAGRRALLQVTDTGPGIRASEHDSIFDEFTRLNEGTDVKGHGLGLAVARRIALLLDGELTVRDGADAGATFVLTLPLQNETGADSAFQPERRNPDPRPS